MIESFENTNYLTDCFKFDSKTGILTGFNITDSLRYRLDNENLINGLVLVIPSSIGGMPVLEIGTGFWIGYDNNDFNDISRIISKVVFPNTIIKIGDSSFNGFNLKTVEIPDSVVSIGNHAFSRSNISKLKIGVNVKYIGCKAFSDNKIEELVLPNGLVTIGEGAFEFNNIKKLIIPNTLKKIGDSAFNFNNIKELIIPEGANLIGTCAFKNNKLTSIVLPNSIKSIGQYAFDCNYLENITFGKNLETIGDASFSNNKLKNIKFSEKVETIGAGSFANNKLENIIFSNSVKKIGMHAFSCNELKEINLLEGLIDIGECAFTDNNLYGSSVTIPKTVKLIGFNAFNLGIELIRNNERYSNFKIEGQLDQSNIYIKLNFQGMNNGIIISDTGLSQITNKDLNEICLIEGIQNPEYISNGVSTPFYLWEKCGDYFIIKQNIRGEIKYSLHNKEWQRVLPYLYNFIKYIESEIFEITLGEKIIIVDMLICRNKLININENSIII